jgi:hypothetical protein
MTDKELAERLRANGDQLRSRGVLGSDHVASLLEEAAARLEASASPPSNPSPEPAESGRWSVKKLEWQGHEGVAGCFAYKIAPPDRTPGWRVWCRHNDKMASVGAVIVTLQASDESEAKAVAQADYETRIRSALIPASGEAAPPSGMVEALKEARPYFEGWYGRKAEVLAKIDAALTASPTVETASALPPDGMVAVPREPTPGMRQAGGEANCPTISLTTACDYAVDVYRAMLVAVPRNFLEAIRDEDLNEPISDAGHTVGDGLKADARRYLGGPTNKKICTACSGKGEVTWETTFCEYERGKCPECNGKGFKGGISHDQP